MAQSAEAKAHFGKVLRKVDDRVPEILKAWLSHQFAKPVDLIDFSIPAGAGMSGQTYVVSAVVGGKTEDLVVRQEPFENPLFFESDLPAWATAQQIIGQKTDVPAPQVIAIETETAILGSPFFVMRRLHGTIPPDQPCYRASGWVRDAKPADRAAMWRSAVEQLHKIHQLDWQQLDLGFIRRGTEASEIAQEIDYFARFCDWAYGARTELVDATLVWLLDNIPSQERLQVCWGDARPANMMFSGNACVGILDWELVSIGDPVKDIAWWAFSEYMFDCLLGERQIEGCLSGNDLLAVYQEVSGDPLETLPFYQIFTALRALAITQRSTSIQCAQAGLPRPADDNFVTAELRRLLSAQSSR